MMTYRTPSDAIADLKKRGYTIDFNLGYNGVYSYRSSLSLPTDQFDIAEVYRFEKSVDPNEVIYAIESHDGHKGTLINDDRLSADLFSTEMLQKFSVRELDQAMSLDDEPQSFHFK